MRALETLAEAVETPESFGGCAIKLRIIAGTGLRLPTSELGDHWGERHCWVLLSDLTVDLTVHSALGFRPLFIGDFTLGPVTNFVFYFFSLGTTMLSLLNYLPQKIK
ncbi:hypothetical protein RchiOBHm_Chr6g0244861 [Rosa chinensis]|uniref:Uncharacterized protein n=1 Tax=Rosa chinensis TaxID=74649 RepID=A0A2P6PJ49_ROSCH|nr:hypothetical protein RchiOBHm_Chr6g0244861 [Rosa chinensis]